MGRAGAPAAANAGVATALFGEQQFVLHVPVSWVERLGALIDRGSDVAGAATGDGDNADASADANGDAGAKTAGDGAAGRGGSAGDVDVGDVLSVEFIDEQNAIVSLGDDKRPAVLVDMACITETYMSPLPGFPFYKSGDVGRALIVTPDDDDGRLIEFPHGFGLTAAAEQIHTKQRVTPAHPVELVRETENVLLHLADKTAGDAMVVFELVEDDSVPAEHGRAGKGGGARGPRQTGPRGAHAGSAAGGGAVSAASGATAGGGSRPRAGGAASSSAGGGRASASAASHGVHAAAQLDLSAYPPALLAKLNDLQRKENELRQQLEETRERMHGENNNFLKERRREKFDELKQQLQVIVQQRDNLIASHAPQS